MPEQNDEGLLTYMTPRNYPEQLVGRVVATSDYGYDFELQNFDHTLRVLNTGEVFTVNDMIGSDAQFQVR